MIFASSVFIFFFLPIILLFYYNPLVRQGRPVKWPYILLFPILLHLYRDSGNLFFFMTTGGCIFLVVLATEFCGKDSKIIRFFQMSSRTYRNLVLLTFSLFFYAWGEPLYVLLLILSLAMNYGFGLLAGCYSRTLAGRWVVAMAVLCNVVVFFVFKYMDFVFQNCNYWFRLDLPLAHFALPIGISFYTFQALSYVIDVYRGGDAELLYARAKMPRGDGNACPDLSVKAEKNPLNVALYIALFPQLIAGPIVRYTTVAKELTSRIENKNDFASGLVRFSIGLGKKMILANPCAFIADMAFSAGPDAFSVLLAWMGAIAYTLQIYFDFSGYSDMAIGLGRMFGFHFPENFNFPYIARSITDFWRRWHISLSTWFRDYVYFPLGGSRVNSNLRLVFNLFVVWLLTGIWHGANWTFVLWGFFYFVLLSIEKLTGFDKKKSRWGFLYTMPCVIVAWVFFRSESISSAWLYVKTMFGFGNMPLKTDYAVFQLLEYLPFFVLATICALPVIPFLRERFLRPADPEVLPCQWRTAGEYVRGGGYFICISLIFFLAVSYVVKSTNNPFIYFNF